MNVLLSNPRKRRKQKTTSKRTGKVRTRRRVARRTTKGSVIVARRKKSVRRRRAPARRRRGSAAPRRGFAHTSTIQSVAGLTGGLLLAPQVARLLPASLTQAGGQYGLPAIKIGLGFLTAKFVGKYNKPLGLSLGAGMMASGALDLVSIFKPGAAAGTLPGVRGYGDGDDFLNGYGDVGGGEGVNGYGDVTEAPLMLPDGTTINGYVSDDGTAMDGYGNVLGNVDITA